MGILGFAPTWSWCVLELLSHSTDCGLRIPPISVGPIVPYTVVIGRRVEGRTCKGDKFVEKVGGTCEEKWLEVFRKFIPFQVNSVNKIHDCVCIVCMCHD